MKSVTILGSTGSIGVNTLRVIREHPDRFRVDGLAAGSKTDILEELLSKGTDAEEIIKEKGLAQITDEGAIKSVVKEVLDSNPDQLKQLKEGKEKVRGFFVGQIMKKMSGKASPAVVNKLIDELLRL